MYKILGADQKEYGPATQEQVRQWVSEGRANAQTIACFEDGPWKPLATFPEFGPLFAAAAGPSTVPPVVSAGTAATEAPLLVPSASGAKNNPMAVAGLILGILGFLSCCTPLTSTLGLIFSIIGLSQINQKPQLYSGKALAIAGIVFSLLGFVTFPFVFRRFSHRWRF